MEAKIKLVVVNEQYLGYIDPVNPKSVGVLFFPKRGDLCGPFTLYPNDKVRLANNADFVKYRTSPAGFLDEPDKYEFDPIGIEEADFSIDCNICLNYENN